MIIAASLMLHNPENYITQWAHVKKSETIKQMQTDEVGENGIERKFFQMVYTLQQGLLLTT